MTIIITVNLFHLPIYLLSISGVLESLLFWNFHNFCVLVGGCYSASSESFPSWSRWDVLRSWVATISSWHQWRRRRLGEKNSKRNLRTKVRNQIKLNFTESLYLVYYGFIMGTNFCRLRICILSSHPIPFQVGSTVCINTICYQILDFKEHFILQIKWTTKIHKNWFSMNIDKTPDLWLLSSEGVLYSSSYYYHFKNWRIKNK